MEKGFKGVEIVLLGEISGSRRSGGRSNRKRTGDFRCIFSNVDVEKKCVSLCVAGRTSKIFS